MEDQQMINRDVFAKNKLLQLLEELEINDQTETINSVVDRLKSEQINAHTAKNILLVRVRNMSRHLYEVEQFLKELDT